MKKHLVVHLCWISVMLVNVLGCSKVDTPPEPDKIVMVTQPSIQQSQLQRYAGEVKARQQTTLSFRIGGQVLERYVDVGDKVKTGQVLARLDTQDAQLQQDSMQAQLDQAQANLKTAEADYQRFKQLLPEKAVSRAQFDAAENQYHTAQAGVQQAQAKLDNSKNQLQYNQLIANQNGVITQRNFEIGQVLAAGQTAYQIALNGDKDVVIGIPEQQIQDIHLKQAAYINTWGDTNKRYAGYVREIAPAADQSRTFAVKVALKDVHAPIQLGQSAQVFFDTTVQQQLTVPLSSVSAKENKPYIFVLQPNHTLKQTSVEVGEYGRATVTILSGLDEQQWVVVGGVHLLRDKQHVQAVDASNRPLTDLAVTQ